VARYWSINTAATAVPLSVSYYNEISGGHIGRAVVRTRCSAGPCGLLMGFTFDLWPSKPLQQCPLTWWISVPSFIEILPLSTEVSSHEIGVNRQRTDGQRTVDGHHQPNDVKNLGIRSPCFLCNSDSGFRKCRTPDYNSVL